MYILFLYYKLVQCATSLTSNSIRNIYSNLPTLYTAYTYSYKNYNTNLYYLIKPDYTINTQCVFYCKLFAIITTIIERNQNKIRMFLGVSTQLENVQANCRLQDTIWDMNCYRNITIINSTLGKYFKLSKCIIYLHVQLTVVNFLLILLFFFLWSNTELYKYSIYF